MPAKYLYDTRIREQPIKRYRLPITHFTTPASFESSPPPDPYQEICRLHLGPTGSPATKQRHLRPQTESSTGSHAPEKSCRNGKPWPASRSALALGRLEWNSPVAQTKFRPYKEYKSDLLANGRAGPMKRFVVLSMAEMVSLPHCCTIFKQRLLQFGASSPLTISPSLPHLS